MQIISRNALSLDHWSQRYGGKYIKLLVLMYQRHWLYMERDGITRNRLRQGGILVYVFHCKTRRLANPRFEVPQGILKVGQ